MSEERGSRRWGIDLMMERKAEKISRSGCLVYQAGLCHPVNCSEQTISSEHRDSALKELTADIYSLDGYRASILEDYPMLRLVLF
jgi:hypothetical protein